MFKTQILYEYRLILADSDRSMRCIYIDIRDDRMVNDDSRCWDMPMSGHNPFPDFVEWKFLDGWQILYKHSDQ